MATPPMVSEIGIAKRVKKFRKMQVKTGINPTVD
jgi:hypothetical protein